MVSISHIMTETTMPAAEATTNNFDERNSYEFAFHVLPTVAEGEVAGIFETIKAQITRAGEIFDEETPERTDLVYAIVKPLEGKNRKFTSAYFGWVRFKAEADAVSGLMEELSVMPVLLRHLLIKLTPLEEANPFKFHEYRKTLKMVEVVDESVVADEEIEADISGEVLDESIDKVEPEEEVK